jgi:hypothetical protein
VTPLIVVSVMLRNPVGETDPLAEQHCKPQGAGLGARPRSLSGSDNGMPLPMRPSRRRSGYRRGAHFNVSAFMVMRGINMIVLTRGRHRML